MIFVEQDDGALYDFPNAKRRRNAGGKKRGWRSRLTEDVDVC